MGESPPPGLQAQWDQMRAAFVEGMTLYWECYQAAIRVGFTPEQAIELTALLADRHFEQQFRGPKP
jgi:hypothetical protein